MKTRQLDYDLPEDLIAQRPADRRSDSRLLVMDRASGALSDRRFFEIAELLDPTDCLVLNNTRVLAARFFVRRATGGRIEGLFLCQPQPGHWEVMLKNAQKVRPGEYLSLLDHTGQVATVARVVERLGEGLWQLHAGGTEPAESLLDRIGFAPLPPYIKRRYDTENPQNQEDHRRYQTVYAASAGAVAAPTAGLHFTDELLAALRNKGISIAQVTLHVGAGTFKPVTVETLADHDIHSETWQIDDANAAIINEALDRGRRIIAVGTTSVRTLETAGSGGRILPGSGQTRLFILPGYKFRIVQGMITNFHLPRSTLLALVAAFTGLDPILAAYRHAIEQRYRFYSYGDAMLIM
ncbi:MAG: tRNA preQ1(34) S-adenosylmethionine ribosyltransferase-isomerase QueA [Phycisphaerae bacterium]|nr:tRNA preQ1(34) S-adenosylmethionine ribosyltransferase-isomerase QueA [Phycisphaerae bacterium]